MYILLCNKVFYLLIFWKKGLSWVFLSVGIVLFCSTVGISVFCPFSWPSENIIFMPLYKSVIISPRGCAALPQKGKNSYINGDDGDQSYGTISYSRGRPEKSSCRGRGYSMSQMAWWEVIQNNWWPWIVQQELKKSSRNLKDHKKYSPTQWMIEILEMNDHKIF